MIYSPPPPPRTQNEAMDNDNEMGRAFLTGPEKPSDTTTYTVTLSNSTVLLTKVLLVLLLISSLATMGLAVAGCVVASRYLSGEYTIDSVSLIPSVSSLLSASTNSVQLNSALTSASSIFSALSTIRWDRPPPKSCRTYYGCDPMDINYCEDFYNEYTCSAVVADNGVFHPREHCEWFPDSASRNGGYCDGNPVVCTTTKRIADVACWDLDGMSSEHSQDLQNAFLQTSIRLSSFIDHTRDSSRSKTPKSSFDFMHYVATELGKDWGEILNRFAGMLGDLAECDWEEIFTTFSGPLQASEMAANTVVYINGYKGWLEIVAEPLKKIKH
ncbi:hypothetical protein TrCOL_g5836 [Triparma columacea]|uniref:Uncharacterized protein n=1 Tax=Triparma columacea TaxID=722753 RepID=A0A9W7LE57_9STRA|nr:hypothetical protein TrCOL_g5836 [Triparma columacea]